MDILSLNKIEVKVTCKLGDDIRPMFLNAVEEQQELNTVNFDKGFIDEGFIGLCSFKGTLTMPDNSELPAEVVPRDNFQVVGGLIGYMRVYAVTSDRKIASVHNQGPWQIVDCIEQEVKNDKNLVSYKWEFLLVLLLILLYGVIGLLLYWR